MNYSNPRIKPIYPLYKLNDKEFRIGAQLGITKEFEDPDGYLWHLACLLDGRNFEEVSSRMIKKFKELTIDDVIIGIEILDKEGFLEETYDEKEKNVPERYIPNVNYFRRFTKNTESPIDIQEKINNSTILLLGLGGAGSNILTLLSGLGPKKIIIVDYDNIEESNLGRQLLYKESDIGKPKVEVAAKNIREMNSKIIIEPHNLKISSPKDILNIINDSDIVISAIDEPPFTAFRNVNKAIVEAGVPCVFAVSQVSRGRVFTIIPKETRCFDCLNIQYTLGDEKFVEQFIGFSNINFNPPSIAYPPGIFQLTAYIVDEVIKILTGYDKPRTLEAQCEINYEDGSSFMHPAYKRHGDKCPTCGNGHESDWEVFKYYKE
ncbi:MAG: ThiF family adenylyltransferase [Defluviitaleaceae bacterium]|nr:ThiF family adenylyltransferase [Defluviitaleaceae bacterium]